MPRGKTIMPARLQVQQFIEWISVRHPCGPFLLRSEEIAVPVELQRHDVAQSGGQLLHFPVRRDLQEAAAALVRGIARHAFVIGPVGIARRAIAHGHIHRAIRAYGQSHAGIHAPVLQVAGFHQLRIVEALRHADAAVGDAVSVSIFPAHDLISQDSPRHAVLHRHAQRVVRPGLRGKGVQRLLQTVSVAVAQQMKAAVVSASIEPAVRGVFDVVQTCQAHRQFPHGEARH